MSTLYTQHHIDISAPLDTIWNNILYFDRVMLWSEWLRLETRVQIHVNGKDGEEGASQSWNGEIIGSGKRVNEKIIPKEYIERELFLHSPTFFWGRVFYSFQKIGTDQYRIIHGMRARLPLYKYFSKGKIQKQLQRDLARGLRMLKCLSETGSIPSLVEHLGKREYEANYILYKENTACAENIGQKMKEDYADLQAFCKQQSIAPRSYLAYYPKVNEKKNLYHFWSAISISSDVYHKISDDLPKGIKKESFTNTTVLTVRHRGSYEFLGNAWRAAYARKEKMKLTKFKKIPPFEEYINMSEGEFLPITDINIPLN